MKTLGAEHLKAITEIQPIPFLESGPASSSADGLISPPIKELIDLMTSSQEPLFAFMVRDLKHRTWE